MRDIFRKCGDISCGSCLYVTVCDVWSEKDLVLELEKMRAKHGVCGRERSPSRLDAFVRSLEEERDFYRREAEKYKQARGGGGPALSPGRSPDRGSAVRSRGSKVIIHPLNPVQDQWSSPSCC